MPSQISNQLKSQSLNDVLSSAFKQVGGPVYPDATSSDSLLDLVAVVNAFQATHMVAYGNAIPDSGTGYMHTLTSDNPEDVVAPLNNQCVRLNAVSVTNAGGAAPIQVNLHIGATLLSAVTVGPSESIAVLLNNQITLSKGQTLTATQVSGTATDITVDASAVLTCQ